MTGSLLFRAKGLFGGSKADWIGLWITNAGAVDITVNSIRTFQEVVKGHEGRLIVGCLDDASRDALSSALPGVELMMAEGLEHWRRWGPPPRSDYMEYNTADFNLISAARYAYLIRLMTDRRRPVLYVDSDIGFLRDPMPEILGMAAEHPESIITQNDMNAVHADATIAAARLGHGEFPKNASVCAGFSYWRPTEAQLKFCERIGDKVRQREGRQHDQTIWNKAADSWRRNVRLLPIRSFPNGSFCFGENGLALSSPTENCVDWREACMVHANYLVGMNAKVAALKSAGLWRL